MLVYFDKSNKNPSSYDKEAYAKGLVTAFPILKVDSGEHNYVIFIIYFVFQFFLQPIIINTKSILDSHL